MLCFILQIPNTNRSHLTGQIAGDVPDGLLSLVDKSLLREEELPEAVGGEPRFWMLQMLREFGLEHLASTGETEVTRQAHASYYLALAEEAEPHLRGAEQERWLARLQQEHENMRAVFSWLLESARLEAGTQQGQQQAELALRLCVALEPFWYSRVYSREGLSFLQQALATRENVTTPLRARALYAAAELAWMLDNTELTETLCAEGLALFRTLGDTAGIADALALFGTSAWARGQYTLARPQVEEAATLYQQMGNSWKQGRCLTQLSRIATVQGDYDQAHRLLEQSMAIYKTLGDKERIGWVLYLQAQLLFLSQRNIAQASHLTGQSLALLQEIDSPWGRAYSLVLSGQIMLQQGEQAQARDFFEQSVASFKEMGDRGGTTEGLMGLARLATLQDDLVAARTLYVECQAIIKEIGYQEQVAPALEGLATVAAKQGEPVRAAQIWGAAEALREALSTPIPPVYRLDYQQAVAFARSQSGEDAFARAWSKGRTLTPEQALANQDS